MSQYTTGELAKLCGVTVRTVQFYDTKGILCPSALTEGGRRIYSDQDLKQLRLICLLKTMGLTLESIKEILVSKAPDQVLQLLLEEQLHRVEGEIAQKEDHAGKKLLGRCQNDTGPIYSRHRADDERAKAVENHSYDDAGGRAYHGGNRDRAISMVDLYWNVGSVRGWNGSSRYVGHFSDTVLLPSYGLSLSAVPGTFPPGIKGVFVLRAYAKNPEAMLSQMRIPRLLCGNSFRNRRKVKHPAP